MNYLTRKMDRWAFPYSVDPPLLFFDTCLHSLNAFSYCTKALLCFHLGLNLISQRLCAFC